MKKDPTSPPPDISASFQDLQEAAGQLNAVSDNLAAPIERLDSALKRLNLGVPAWVEFRGGKSDPYGNYWTEEIGYAKVGSKWGIALRTVAGNESDDPWDSPASEEWLFNDAPRALRVRALEGLPENIENLIRALIVAAQDTANKIMEKVGQAEQIAEKVSGVPRVASAVGHAGRRK